MIKNSKHSEASIEKMRKAFKGKPKPPSHSEKRRRYLTGRTLSQETKDKIAESMREYYRKKKLVELGPQI